MVQVIFLTSDLHRRNTEPCMIYASEAHETDLYPVSVKARVSVSGQTQEIGIGGFFPTFSALCHIERHCRNDGNGGLLDGW